MKNKRIFIMLAVMILCVSAAAFSYQIGKDRELQVNQTVNVSERFEVNAVTARESAANIDRYLEENYQKNRTESDEGRYTMNGITPEGYPDYYGGMYINAEGNLVVLLTEEYKDGLFFSNSKAKSVKEEIARAAGQNDIIFGYVKYSLRELLDTVEKIRDFKIANENAKQPAHITDFGAWQNKNVVRVGMYPLNEETEKWFRENIDDKEYIVFEETGLNAIEATASIRPGENGNFSAGFYTDM